MDKYTYDGHSFESEELFKASAMRFPEDAWAIFAGAFTPREVIDITFPTDDDGMTLTATYFNLKHKRIEQLADILEKTGDPSLMECAAEVRAALLPYRERMEKYLAEKSV